MRNKIQTPSYQEVEVAIKGLEIEDEREKEALRKFYERERQQNRTANLRLLWAVARVLGKVVLVALAVGAILWLT